MAITSRMNRKQFAAAVVAQLEKHNVSCALVGGACLSIYTDEKHKSRDLDFISPNSVEIIETALGEIGFKKDGRLFRHPKSELYVEFPSGPVAIGNESPVKPQGTMKVGRTVVRMLSPTQCVMDRLAAWFHWSDRRSMIHAIWVCEKQAVNLSRIKTWAKKEGELERYDEFIAQLKEHLKRKKSKS